MTEAAVQDYAAWRDEARRLLKAAVPPSHVNFITQGEAGQSRLAFDVEATAPQPAQARVSAEFLKLAECVAHHRDPARWNMLYSLLWRLTHGEPHALIDHSDPLVRDLRLMEKAIRRDVHKMHAFVRFRETADGVFAAWYRPQHLIVRLGAPFFMRRFGSMKWWILTPDECAYWDMQQLTYGPGMPRETDPPEDAVESLWLDYYSSIFNPARVKLKAMTAEMPVHHWATLPESRVINELVRNSGMRVGNMLTSQPDSADDYLPEDQSLPSLADAARGCQGCELSQHATQTVFGAGPSKALLMLVGEQPGDQEDTAGQPFVGPAGQLLNRALDEAGIDRSKVYVTNAVKHFYFEERGKRRIHKQPRGQHISACRPWLEAEIRAVKPQIILCLGATAAQSLMGRQVKILSERGQWIESKWARRLMVTVHPSMLLRIPEQNHPEAYTQFLLDLKKVAAELHG